MRKYVFWLLGLIFGLPLAAIVLVLVAANTSTGRTFITDSAHTLTQQRLTLSELTGHFPEQVRVGRVIWQDSQGVLTIEQLQIAWQPWQLFTGLADIRQVEVAHFSFVANPNAPPPPPSPPFDFASLNLPLTVKLGQLHIGQIDLTAMSGQTLGLTLDGQAQLRSLQQGDLHLSVKDTQHQGSYTVTSHIDANRLSVQASVQEPAQGLLSQLLNWQDAKPLVLEASVDGPLDQLTTRLDLDWDLLKAKMAGTFNAKNQQIDWQINAQSPAMQAHADLAWQQLAINGKLQGALTQPTLDGHIDIQTLRVAKTVIRQLHLLAQGDSGQLHLSGSLAGLTLAEGQQDVLQAQPINLQAALRMDQAAHPLTLALQHPLFSVTGTAATAPQPNATMQVNLPHLQALAGLAGVDMAGTASATLQARQQGDKAEINVDGQVAMTGGPAALVNLLGKQADFGITLLASATEQSLSRCQVQGKAITLQASGSLKEQLSQLDWQLDINDLGAVIAKAQGKLNAKGQLSGPLTDMSTVAEVNGEFGMGAWPRKPITAQLKADHLPQQASGQFTAHTVWLGAPLELAAEVKPLPNQARQISINRADWKSLHSQGLFVLPPASAWPTGTLDISIKRLDDLRGIVDVPITGAVTANLKTNPANSAEINVTLRSLGVAANTRIDQGKLTLTVQNALAKPRLHGQLALQGLTAGTLAGTAQMDVDGTLEHLAIQASSHFDKPLDSPVNINSTGFYSASTQALELATLTAQWQKQELRLLAPASISLGKTLSVAHLQAGWGEARLLADGQLSPALALNAQVRQLNLDSVKLLIPSLPISGKVSAEAQLQGNLSQPTGTLTLNAEQLRLVGGNANALPPAHLNTTITLDSLLAHLQTQLKAGDNANLQITGTAPLKPDGLLDLKVKGLLELKLFDALLSTNGRRSRGQISLDGGLAGTLAQPLVTGTATLNKVEVRDYAIGANITAINGIIRAKDQQLLIEKLVGTAGEGTVTVTGSIDVLKAGIPVNLKITANKAKPLASDRLAVDLNADLTLRGSAAEHLLLLGAIQINRADIRIPEHLPANLAVLKLKTPGQREVPEASRASMDLNLVITAIDEIFVRGRGVEAELAGTVQVHGTANAPEPAGGFSLRRGQYNLAGKTLTFSQGRVSFDGGKLTDPSLNFIVTNTKNSFTTTLTIGGTASNPKITLSSVPELPQDEILARLLFGQSASSLSVLEMVQIGSAVASLSGATSSMGDPLDKIRSSLGLDRLSVGGQNTSLEAGRYVVPGVYLGTRQGLTGTPQATIQIDLTKHIKLEAAVGATSSTSKNANPNSLGIIYEFDY
ncbi:translocation/assembly module TamB domain-containing protein [Methylovulum psychrotolerans]|uniref:translocation/assembly module TamB domain-containing protein n=1 Tax=Methylovulum psychrotolerans TaxID=1704499 RepID=UPI001BFFC4EE|nr:translocation/assembly module TamB domain-containing protein [Methylovulum psychrotolerans]MBT9099612.1 translocation/assembly module TamB domain-containing protein [Methylovulum psychrotolerans]